MYNNFLLQICFTRVTFRKAVYKKGKKKKKNNPNTIELTVKNLFKITHKCKDFLKDKN